MLSRLFARLDKMPLPKIVDFAILDDPNYTQYKTLK